MEDTCEPCEGQAMITQAKSVSLADARGYIGFSHSPQTCCLGAGRRMKGE